MNLYSEEHKRLLTSFVHHGVKFLVVGGHAAIYHGVTRNTGDLDILIEPTVLNGKKVVESLKSLDLEVPDFEPAEFEKELVLSFGLEPEAVDILNFTPGIEFSAAYKNSIPIDIQGLHVHMINIVDLIRNKENLNRSGEKAYLDKYDAEVLKKILKRKTS